MITWHVYPDGVHVWKDGVFVDVIPKSQGLALIEAVARELRSDETKEVDMHVGLGIRLQSQRPSSGGAPPPSGLILDTLTAGAAYSTRRLRTAYAGAAIRVRRSSDNVEADIGFSGNSLDTAALTAHVGANSGFVVTWYDQTTNARDITQATAGSQPRIVNAGTIDLENGFPTLEFDGVDDHIFNTTPWLYANGVMTACLVASIPAPANERRIFGEGSSTNSQPVYSGQTGGGAGGYDDMSAWVRNDAGVTLLDNLGPRMLADQFDNTIRALVWRDDGSNIDGFGNNTQGTTRTYTRSGVSTLNRFAIGTLLRATPVTPVAMSLSEAIFFPVALSTTDRIAVNTSQAEAYGFTLNPS
jgi:hypothetical protein